MLKRLREKRNNKGFSLVELIVVILIIAILAVAIAPQVMKWVGSSKVSVDKNNATAIKSSVIAAVADYQGTTTESIPAAGAGFTINGNLVTTTPVPTILLGKIEEVFGGDYPKTQDDSNGFNVTINSSGVVSVSCGALSK